MCPELQDVFNMATNRVQVPFPLREGAPATAAAAAGGDTSMSVVGALALDRSGGGLGQQQQQQRRVSDIEVTRAGGPAEVRRAFFFFLVGISTHSCSIASVNHTKQHVTSLLF